MIIVVVIIIIIIIIVIIILIPKIIKTIIVIIYTIHPFYVSYKTSFLSGVMHLHIIFLSDAVVQVPVDISKYPVP